ncbi:hypothetical protein ACWCP6_12940 [Streptomyces sp. NPDC002004]
MLAVPVALLLAGCGDDGGLVSAGTTPTAVGPARLWPELPPAATPALDYGEAVTETVEGITAPGDDIRKVDPVAVVRAEVAQHPNTYSGPMALTKETVDALRACGKSGEKPPMDGRLSACPVLSAYYRDLTGDGRDDMIVGIRLPQRQLALRVYTFEGHKLVQVMGTSDAVSSVEIAGRQLIVRSPSTIPGYEYRTAWSWDPHQHAMLPALDEILRTGKTPASTARPRVPTASPSPVLPVPGTPSSAAPAPPAPSSAVPAPPAPSPMSTP